MGTSYGCRIYKDFKRPDPALVEQFKGMPVATIDDNMQRIAAVDAAIKPVGYKGQMVGVAFTVRVAQGDNLMGDVVVRGDGLCLPERPSVDGLGECVLALSSRYGADSSHSLAHHSSRPFWPPS